MTEGNIYKKLFKLALPIMGAIPIAVQKVGSQIEAIKALY